MVQKFGIETNYVRKYCDGSEYEQYVRVQQPAVFFQKEVGGKDAVQDERGQL